MAATFAVLGTTPLANGYVRKRVRMTCDNAYPVAGYPITPANCGLQQFQINDAGTGFVQPVVTGVNQGGLLAEVQNQLVIISYPTGGATASPTTPAAPLVTAGGVAVTSTAATGVLTPGLGKALANNTNLTGVLIDLDAVGLPA